MCVCAFSFLCARALEVPFASSLVGTDPCRSWECAMSGRFRVFHVCVRAVLSEDARQVDVGMRCAEMVWCGCEL